MDRAELTVLERDEVAVDVVRLTLARSDATALPAWAPGAHIDVELENATRQYSLCSDTGDSSSYQIAVLLAEQSRGGSTYVHQSLTVGSRVQVRGPRNNFALDDAGEYLFIAGGIGITPILPMIRAVDDANRHWRLVYGGRTKERMAFADELFSEHPRQVELVPQDQAGLIDIRAEMRRVEDGGLIYACGPEPLLRACEEVADELCRRADLRIERFTNVAGGRSGDDIGFEVELASSGTVLEVPTDKSVLDVLLDAGVDMDYSCTEGTCGTCETGVVDGQVEHRDAILSPDERAAGDTMFVCVSRSQSKRLVLDL